MLDNLGLSEERTEKFLEHLSVFFFKSDDRNVEKFLLQLELVHKIAINLDVSIFDMPKKIKKLEIRIQLAYHMPSYQIQEKHKINQYYQEKSLDLV